MAGIKELDKVIASGSYESVYVFYGQERGLLTEYLSEITSKFKTVIEENDLKVIENDSKYNSIFGGKKLYVVKDTGFFSKKADDNFINFLIKMFKQKSNICIFVEEKIDGTLKQTQALSDSMKIDFQFMKEGELIILTQKIFESGNKKITKDLARYFIDLCDYSYSVIINEAEKLIHFVDQKNITMEHIRSVTSRSTNAVVFDMITFIVNGNYSRALDMYETLMLRKESALAILTLIYRQLRLLYQIKLIKSEGYSVNEIAEACDSKPFIIEKNLNICNYSTDKLLKLLQKCSEVDFGIKSGRLKDFLGVKVLIFYSSMI